MKTQYGRTLIEILGALALIGALTFIGIESYKILYAKHQANKAFESVQCQMLELDLLDLDRIDLDEDITSDACENDSSVEIKVVRTEMEDEDGGEISSGYYVELTDLTPEACRQVLSKPWETEFEIAVGCEGRTFNPDEPDYSVCDIFDEDYEPECLEEYIEEDIEEDIGEVSLLDNTLPSDSIFHKILGISNAYARYEGATVIYKNGKWIRIYQKAYTKVNASCPRKLWMGANTCCPKRATPYFNGLFSGCCYTGSDGTYTFDQEDGTLTVYNVLFRIRSDIMVTKYIKDEYPVPDSVSKFFEVQLPLQDCCVGPAIRDIYDANGSWSGTRYCCESYEISQDEVKLQLEDFHGSSAVRDFMADRRYRLEQAADGEEGFTVCLGDTSEEQNKKIDAVFEKKGDSCWKVSKETVKEWRKKFIDYLKTDVRARFNLPKYIDIAGEKVEVEFMAPSSGTHVLNNPGGNAYGIIYFSDFEFAKWILAEKGILSYRAELLAVHYIHEYNHLIDQIRSKLYAKSSWTDLLSSFFSSKILGKKQTPYMAGYSMATELRSYLTSYIWLLNVEKYIKGSESVSCPTLFSQEQCKMKNEQFQKLKDAVDNYNIKTMKLPSFEAFNLLVEEKGLSEAKVQYGTALLNSSTFHKGYVKELIDVNMSIDQIISILPSDELLSKEELKRIFMEADSFWDYLCGTSHSNLLECMERQMANRAVKDGLCCDPESEKLYCAKWKKEDINNDGKNDKLHCEDGFAMCCPVDSVVAINKDGNGNLTAECCPAENVYPTREIYKENEWDDQEEGIPLSVCCKDDSYFDEYSKTCCPEGQIPDGNGHCCDPETGEGCECTLDYLEYKCANDVSYCGWKEGLRDGSLVVRGGIVRYSDDYGRKGTCVEGRCVGGEEWCKIPGGCCPCWGLTYENNRPVYDGECSYCPEKFISGYTSEELKAAVERGEVKVKSIPPNFSGGTCLKCADYNGVWYPGSNDKNSVAYTRDSSCLLCPDGTSPEGKGEPYKGVEECRCQYKGQEYLDAGYFDTEENKGCFCPPGTYLNKSKEECSPCGNSDGSDSNEYREEWNNEDSCSICSGQEALAIRTGHTNSVLSEGNDSCVTCYHQYGPEEPYWNGNECVPCYEDISSGGEVWSDEYNEYGSCISCSAKNSLYPRWNDVLKQCEECPPETPLWNGYDSCEPCPAEMPVWNGSYCEPCPPDTPLWDGYSCQPCPNETPMWNGYSCEPCPNETPMWNGSYCESCPPGTVFDSGECRS